MTAEHRTALSNNVLAITKEMGSSYAVINHTQNKAMLSSSISPIIISKTY